MAKANTRKRNRKSAQPLTDAGGKALALLDAIRNFYHTYWLHRRKPRTIAVAGSRRFRLRVLIAKNGVFGGMSTDIQSSSGITCGRLSPFEKTLLRWDALTARVSNRRSVRVNSLTGNVF